MNGNFARSILCSLTTSVDFGLYSWMVGVCCDCAEGAAMAEGEACRVLAAPGHTRAAAQMHASAAAKTEIARQDFIARSSGETGIVSHRAAGEPNVRVRRGGGAGSGLKKARIASRAIHPARIERFEYTDSISGCGAGGGCSAAWSFRFCACPGKICHRY